jgi:hypothetical protein
MAAIKYLFGFFGNHYLSLSRYFHKLVSFCMNLHKIEPVASIALDTMQIDCYDMEIKELEDWFLDREIPNNPSILMNNHVSIFRHKLFIDAQFRKLKANKGNEIYIYELERLKEYQKKLIAKFSIRTIPTLTI